MIAGQLAPVGAFACQQECEKRNWGYTVAGEAEGVRTNGVVFTHIA